ncbi:MAG: S1C family serine protease, partial [Verrucomicrobiota bacterium]
EAVTLGVAGRNLSAAKLDGAAASPTAKFADPVSRLVVFRSPQSLGQGFRLASRAPMGGLLRTPGNGVGGRIQSRVEAVSGKYLPFTLLRLNYDGSPPTPGTPLLNASGAVAAIAHGAVGEKGGYALPVEVLHRALESARQGKGIEKAWLGLTLSPASGSPKIMRVLPDSPASRAGLAKGDVLTEIGGMRVADYGDAVNAFFLLRPGKPTLFKLSRGGVTKQLTLVPAVSKS